MPLWTNYFPKQRQVLLCNFETGFKPPEMVKVRPVIVVSKTSTNGRGLCTVVPVSTTRPAPLQAWHVETTAMFQLPGADVVHWAKCDMLYTVAFARLTMPHRRLNGRREYATLRLSPEDFGLVANGVRHAVL